MGDKIQILQIMRKRKKKNLILVVVAMLGFTACSDDYSPWEMLSAELSSSFPNQTEVISCEGEAFTLNLKTNASWIIETPAWINVDRASGTGDAIVNVTIAKNEETIRRMGSITTDFIGSVEENVAGQETKRMTIQQQASYERIKINILKANIIKLRSYSSNYDKRRLGDYGYHIEYEVESSLSDEELEAIIHNTATLHLQYLIQDGAWDGITYGWVLNTYLINGISITKGTHTIENTNWRKGSYQIHPTSSTEKAYFTYKYFVGDKSKEVTTEGTHLTLTEQ